MNKPKCATEAPKLSPAPFWFINSFPARIDESVCWLLVVPIDKGFVKGIFKILPHGDGLVGGRMRFWNTAFQRLHQAVKIRIVEKNLGVTVSAMVGNPMPSGRIKAVGPDLHDVSHIADEGSFHWFYGNPLTFPGFDFQTSSRVHILKSEKNFFLGVGSRQVDREFWGKRFCLALTHRLGRSPLSRRAKVNLGMWILRLRLLLRAEWLGREIYCEDWKFSD